MQQLGVTDEGIDDLKKTISNGTTETKAERAKEWAAEIGKYIGKEGLKVGADVVKRTALHWLSQYLGWPL